MVTRPEDMTVDFTKLSRMTVRKRMEAVKSPRTISYLEALTPTQIARLFPGKQRIEMQNIARSVLSNSSSEKIFSGDLPSPSTSSEVYKGKSETDSPSEQSKSTPTTPERPEDRLKREYLQKQSIAGKYSKTLGKLRSEKFANQITDDEIRRLAALGKVETGGMKSRSKQAWLETYFNRAMYRDVSLSQLRLPNRKGRSYWGGGLGNPNNVSEKEFKEWQGYINGILAGSNLTDLASDNASNDYRRKNLLAKKRIEQGLPGVWTEGTTGDPIKDMDKGEFAYTNKDYLPMREELRKKILEGDAKEEMPQSGTTNDVGVLPDKKKDEQSSPNERVELSPAYDPVVHEYYKKLDNAAAAEFKKHIEGNEPSYVNDLFNSSKKIETSSYVSSIDNKKLEEINKSRPGHYKGKIVLDDVEYDYGTGSRKTANVDMKRGSSPYGIFDIKRKLHYGRKQKYQNNSFYVNDMFDPKWGVKRSHILIHSAGDLNRLYSAGCFAIKPTQWAKFKSHLLEYMKKTEGRIAIAVNPDGSAQIGSREELEKSAAITAEQKIQQVNKDFPSNNIESGTTNDVEVLPNKEEVLQKESTINENVNNNEKLKTQPPQSEKPKALPKIVEPKSEVSSEPTAIPEPPKKEWTGRHSGPAPTSQVEKTPVPTIENAPKDGKPAENPLPPIDIEQKKEEASPAPKEEKPFVPALKSGGEVQADTSEPLAIHNNKTGQKLADVSPNENINFKDTGRVEVTPDHRNNPMTLEQQRDAMKDSMDEYSDRKNKEMEAQTRLNSRRSEQRMNNPNHQEMMQSMIMDSGNIFKTASFHRAIAKTRFIEAGDPVRGGHWSYGAANVKR